MERCDSDIQCVFEEMVSMGDIDKPRWDPDDRWYPDVDDDDLNENLSHYLDESRESYGV
jgi:hypothetical protein